ncbi:MAG: hypothetical protein HC785_32635 [Calothrix sp. CSU_2_0]|nr:hypothetical protein [Calothrix sp. CSU_2_0]
MYLYQGNIGILNKLTSLGCWNEYCDRTGAKLKILLPGMAINGSLTYMNLSKSKTLKSDRTSLIMT